MLESHTNLKTHAPINNRFQLFWFLFHISSILFFCYLFVSILLFILFQRTEWNSFSLFRFLSKVSLVYKLSNCLRKTVFSFIAKSNGIRVKNTHGIMNHNIHTYAIFILSCPLFSIHSPLFYLVCICPCSHKETVEMNCFAFTVSSFFSFAMDLCK